MKKPRTPYEDLQWLCNAYKHEIERLRGALQQARACLMNLQPDEMTPVTAQMQKMIHEISVALGD